MNSNRYISEADNAEKSGVILGGSETTSKLISTCLSICIPFLGSLYALYYIFVNGLTWIEISCFLLFYCFAGIGIGVGFHRCFTHQGYVVSPFLKPILLFAGSMACEGSIVRWVADHRRHHRFTDRPWDTHSPYYYKDHRFESRLAGFIHSHIGWMFDRTATSFSVYAPDLLDDRQMVLFHYCYFPICALSLLLPWVFGYALGGFQAALSCMLIGGCLRITAFHHVTWAVNSICHTFGNQHSTQDDKSTNNFSVALLTFGEGWHNNHHAQPRAAVHGWRSHEIDLNSWIIHFFSYLGLIEAIVYARSTRAKDFRGDLSEQDANN